MLVLLDGRSLISNEIRLRLIECSMNDAGDLVHALMVNLGSVQVALSDQPSELRSAEASNLLCTCHQLTRLLAGAVQIARRDACSDEPKPRTVTIADLLKTILDAASRRYSVDCGIVVSGEMSNVSVCIDPGIAMFVLELLSDSAAFMMTAGSRVRVDAAFDGTDARLSLCWVQSKTIDAPGSPNRVPSLDTAPYSQPDSKYKETIAACQAILARQGAALDIRCDNEGNLEVAFVLPACVTNPGQFPGLSTVGTPLAEAQAEASNPADSRHNAGRKRSGKMIIQSDRFGTIDVDEQDILIFPRGIIGFANEKEFILVRTRNAHAIGWLQSATTPHMALPVVSAHVLLTKYPDVNIESYAEAAGLGPSLEELAVLVVLNAPPGIPATVNLVAPIIVNATTRRGAQLLLEGTRFTTRRKCPCCQRNKTCPVRFNPPRVQPNRGGSISHPGIWLKN